MHAKLRTALALAAFLAAAPCFSQTDAEADLDYVRDTLPARPDQGLGPRDADEALYAIVRRNPDFAGAAAEFSARYGVTAAGSEAFVHLLAESLRLEARCYEVSPSVCDPGAVAELAARYRSDLAAQDASGRLVIAIAKVSSRYLTPEFLTALDSHPRRRDVLRELYAYSRRALFLAPLVEIDGADAETLAQLLSQNDVGDDVRLAVMEHVIALPDFGERRAAAAIVAQYLGTLLAHGFDATASDFYDDLGDKAAFWRTYAALDRGRYARTREALGRTSSGDLSLDLAASYLLAKRPAEARALLSSLDPVRASAFGAIDRGQAAFLAELSSPKLAEPEIYDYALLGGPLDLAALDAARARGEAPEMNGWLWGARYGAPALRALAERYFRSAEYDDMAAFVAARDDSRYLAVLDGVESRSVRDAAERAFGPSVGERSDYFRREMRAALGAERPRTSDTGAERAVRFEERRVPEAYRTVRGDEPSPVATEALPPSLPVESFRVERLARDGDVWYAVYASGKLDPMAGISGGYWLARSVDGGATWEPALYLGLEKYFPYVVVPDSRLPIVADGKIRLEVVARELETSSITFPPVGLTFKPERSELYLELAFADLARDADGDGLTDVVERRLGTNAIRADSDGDRVPDGSDGQPLLRRDADAAQDGRLADAILGAIAGIDGAAVAARPSLSGSSIAVDGAWFIAGDPELFAAASVPIRLIVRPESDWRSRASHGRLLYPLTIDAFESRDRTRVHVVWSEQWRGGQILLTRGEDGYVVHEISGWIT